MQLYIYLIYQLYVLLRANSQEIPSSPCPGIFRYEFMPEPRDSIYAGVKGVITLEPHLPIFMKVKLHLPLLLKTLYAGRIRLKYNISEIAEKFRLGTFDKAVFYVDFQRDLPVPSLIEIVVNDQLLCWSTPITGRRGETKLEWSYSLTKTNFFDNNNLQKSKAPVKGQWADGKEIIGFHETRELFTIPPAPAFPQTPGLSEIPAVSKFRKIPSASKIPINEKLPWELPGFENCGLEYTPKKLIIGGALVERGQGPWMVPLFTKTGDGLQFRCTSTLISTEYIITAAHCVTIAERQEVNFIAYVGLHNISAWPETHSQMRGISKIHVHPNYTNEVDYDVAILKLSEEVKPSRYVNSVCIWTQEEDLRLVEGREATVFGWGLDSVKGRSVDTPRFSRLPIVSQETCRESNANFRTLTSSRTLCAGRRNGYGPCNGDSGGGLLLSQDDQFGKRWILRGVTSASLKGYDNTCDLTNYIIFTDVAKYKKWILSFVLKG